MKAIEHANGKAATPAVIGASDTVDFATLGPTTAIAIKSGGREYRITPSDVMKWIAPDAPMNEAVKLLVTAQNVGLNPMLKEIELLPVNGTHQIYVRKSGLFKVAQRYPEYDGHESGVVIRKTDDEYATPIDIPGTIVPRGNVIVGGWAKVYRKGWSRPVYKRIALQNYSTGKGIWLSNPGVMCEKTALAHCWRESFPIGEIYDEAELPVQVEAAVSGDPVYFTPPSQGVAVTPAPAAIEPEYTPPPTTPTPTPAPPVVPGFEVVDVEVDDATPDHEKPCTTAQVHELMDLLDKLGADEMTRAKILEKRGCEAVHQLTVWQATDLKIKLIERLDAATFDFLAQKQETAAAGS